LGAGGKGGGRQENGGEEAHLNKLRDGEGRWNGV
jgi:hypothetical protein